MVVMMSSRTQLQAAAGDDDARCNGKPSAGCTLCKSPLDAVQAYHHVAQCMQFPKVDFDAVEHAVYRYVTRSLLCDGSPQQEKKSLSFGPSSLDPKTTRRLQEVITDAVHVLEEAVEKYGVNDLALSFNGGKDCTVLLYLLAAVMNRYFRWRKDSAMSLNSWAVPTVFVTQENGFPEEISFVAKCASRYNLDVTSISSPMQRALFQFLEKRPSTKAICVGTRRTDPWAANLHSFERCDVERGWPDFVRVNPILDWDFADVWHFLLALNVEYCCLYDHGFTSLGSRDRTAPNPDLFVPESDPPVYYPAWMLKDCSRERCGRKPNSPQESNP